MNGVPAADRTRTAADRATVDVSGPTRPALRPEPDHRDWVTVDDRLAPA